MGAAKALDGDDCLTDQDTQLTGNRITGNRSEFSSGR
jgi:hypothetical protein